MKPSIAILISLLLVTAVFSAMLLSEGCGIDRGYRSRILLRRGNGHFDKGEFEAAVADYTKAIELKSDYAEAYYNRGNAYDNKGDKDRAIADYNRAIEIKSDFAEAYSHRGYAYADKGDKDRAIADFRESLKLFTDPDKAEVALRELRRLGAK
jgi:tetratricopeptide (TPR) repeat protein